MAADTTVRGVTLVLFGGTGDLATRKLLPALFQNWQEKQLADFLVLGVGRRVKDVAEYRHFLDERVGVARERPAEWRQFLEMVHYHQGDVNTREDFEALRQTVAAQERQRAHDRRQQQPRDAPEGGMEEVERR